MKMKTEQKQQTPLFMAKDGVRKKKKNILWLSQLYITWPDSVKI